MSFLKELCEEYNAQINSSGIEISEENNSPLEVVLKDGQLDTSKITEYKGDALKKFEFRPQKWEQFIGQSEAKRLAKKFKKKIKHGNMKSHFFIDGIKGHGKTTYVELFAKDLNAHLIERVGKQINEDNLIDIINEINTCEEQNVILFVDEMDSMDSKIVKVLNPIIESFKIAGKKIKPFIFVGATINKHILIKNNPDTLDRIPPTHHIKFNRYNTNEIATILEQYHQQLFSNITIDKEIYFAIGKNCKFNPRTAIAMLEDYVVEKDIQKVLDDCKIVKDGLNNVDIRILKILNARNKPIGAKALAQKAGLNEKEYTTEFEPYLFEYDYIDRVPSRIITEKGKILLSKIKNKENNNV